MKARDVYDGSDGVLTRAYYAELEKCGPLGLIAMNLFRAQKSSSRAKVYRGGIRGVGRYKDMAYDRKAWSMKNLVEVLEKHGEGLGLRYGWKADPSTLFGEKPSWVLYIDIPQGQVSFHSPARFDGPDYAGDFDGARLSADRILAFCDWVYARDERQTAFSSEEERCQK